MENRFSLLADEFISRVRGACIGPDTDVVVIYHYVDRDGNDLPVVRHSIVPTTKVCSPGDQDFARQFAATAHLETIIGNINSLVRPLANDPTWLPLALPQAVSVSDVTLEIIQPTE